MSSITISQKIINPNSRKKVVWDVLVLVLTIFATVYIPFAIVSGISGSKLFQVLNLLISIIFFLDILVEFRTGFYEQREFITGKNRIIKNYLKHRFALDLIAILPIASISTLFLSYENRHFAVYFTLLRLVKLFRVKKTISRIRNNKHINPSFIRMGLLSFWILISAHLISCAWMAVWDDPALLNPINAAHPYLRAFYWTMTTLTTIGYGDITPNTSLETLFVIIVELIGAGMYGFIIGNIANIIANIDVAKSQYQEKMEKVTTFLRYKNIPLDLKTKIIDYYDYLWESRRGYNEASILEDLPKPLQTSVALFLNQSIIQKVPIFQGASEEFIKEIILNLKPVVFTPGDYIVVKGEIGYEMYFISKGLVDVVSEDDSLVYATLGTGSFFGEIALLLSVPRNASIKAREYCDCYSLDKETFERVLIRFPRFAKRIREMAEKRQEETAQKQSKRKEVAEKLRNKAEEENKTEDDNTTEEEDKEKETE